MTLLGPATIQPESADQKMLQIHKTASFPYLHTHGKSAYWLQRFFLSIETKNEHFLE